MHAQAAVEEGIVVGGGCALLRLAQRVAAIKESLPNVEQKVGVCCAGFLTCILGEEYLYINA